jgi:hypothetical protein
MASQFTTRLSSSDFFTLDYENETIEFSCPMCNKNHKIKLTVQFLLENETIGCDNCQGLSITNFLGDCYVTQFD